MIDLRDLQLLTALARHRHFARAARDCGISQPAFSMRIRNLEDRLGVPIVRRANRFQGLTEQGEMIVARARGLLDDARALEEEVRATRGEISGPLVLGVIPTAAAPAARLAMALTRAHPMVLPRIETMTSATVRARIEDGSIDAGLTYADSVSGDPVSITPVLTEHYVLLVPERMAPAGRERVTWAEAAAMPLALLEPGMQNRRILDRLFRDLDLRPGIVAETNGFIAAMVMARAGVAATVVPEAMVADLGELDGTRALPLDDPPLERAIVLVTEDRDPERPVIRALMQAVSSLSQ